MTQVFSEQYTSLKAELEEAQVDRQEKHLAYIEASDKVDAIRLRIEDFLKGQRPELPGRNQHNKSLGLVGVARTDIEPYMSWYDTDD